MKRYAGWVALVAGVAVFTASCAEHSSTLKPVSPGATVTGTGEIAPATTDFEGTISRIDVQNNRVTVQHWPLSKTFRVPPDCQIDVLTNANATLSELKIDDSVAVTYTEAGKDLVASHIARRGKAYDQEKREQMERLNDMLNPSPNQ
jgi:Cu/Ag efflux protein CusF